MDSKAAEPNKNHFNRLRESARNAPHCPFSPLHTRSGGGPVFPASSVYPVKRERGLYALRGKCYTPLAECRAIS